MRAFILLADGTHRQCDNTYVVVEDGALWLCSEATRVVYDEIPAGGWDTYTVIAYDNEPGMPLPEELPTVVMPEHGHVIIGPVLVGSINVCTRAAADRLYGPPVDGLHELSIPQPADLTPPAREI